LPSTRIRIANVASLIRATAVQFGSNGWKKLADEHDRENGREQGQQSFVPWAHDKITSAGTLRFHSWAKRCEISIMSIGPKTRKRIDQIWLRRKRDAKGNEIAHFTTPCI
jgi:hypothetical protein